MASATVGTGASGTVADVEFTVGACESRSAAAGSARTSVQALTTCKDTGLKSAITCEFPGAMNLGSSTFTCSACMDRALYREKLYKDSETLEFGEILVLYA